MRGGLESKPWKAVTPKPGLSVAFLWPKLCLSLIPGIRLFLGDVSIKVKILCRCTLWKMEEADGTGCLGAGSSLQPGNLGFPWISGHPHENPRMGYKYPGVACASGLLAQWASYSDRDPIPTYTKSWILSIHWIVKYLNVSLHNKG